MKIITIITTFDFVSYINRRWMIEDILLLYLDDDFSLLYNRIIKSIRKFIKTFS